MKEYTGNYIDKIAFPLGGIGTGNISLAGNGAIVDPEINGHPDREKDCGFTNFAIKAESDGEVIDSRLLCGDYIHDYMGTIRGSYGIGNSPLSGFKHFEKSVFKGEFPFAQVELTDSDFPAEVVTEAFNPFIPSNDRDSSIPAAFFNITIKNTSNKTIKYTVLGTVSNLLKNGGCNCYTEKNGVKMITLNGAADKNRDDNITIATDAENTAHQDYWFRGGWFDTLTMFMNELGKEGEITERVYDTENPGGNGDAATLTAAVELKPGDIKTVKFLISWHVPYFSTVPKDYWLMSEEKVIRNYYSVLFKNSVETANYCFGEWQRLYSETKMFANALYSSTLPAEIKEAIQGNLAVLKSTTCLRLENGSFWAWEGVYRNIGSCAGTCQHVWNYAYALPFLFPKLEMSIRTNEFKHCLEKSGMLRFRMPVDLEHSVYGARSCVDGQMGNVVKCYREWKISGDDKWLKDNWNDIKKTIEYAWSKENFDKWDSEKSGVITGRQHHTLDVEMFGLYSWLTGFYHAALLAGAEMAEYLGEENTAEEYRALFEKGGKTLDKTFNGEYYEQHIDITDKSLLDKFNAANEYWNAETAQIKYQICSGSGIDQVLADWHTDLVGLPNVFVKEHRKSALEAIYKYNFVKMHDNHNPCRVFACNDEKGVTMFRWPDISKKPKIPVPYSEECMTGFEYAVADNMLQCGMEDKALEIVRAIRERYDGEKRNPWAEIECGASYARAMASYSFLLTYSGFVFDLPKKRIGFKPIKNGRYFWSVDGAWGTVRCSDKDYEFTVLYGKIKLESFVTSLKSVSAVLINGNSVNYKTDKDVISVNCTLKENYTLKILR